MKDLSTTDVNALKEIKALIQTLSTKDNISPECQIYLYDNVYRPVNDLLSIHGYSKPDNGELS